MPDRPTRGDVAVLASGGIDSAILCVELTRRFDRVHPIYVRFGLRWESAELLGLRCFLGQVARPGLGPLTVLDQPVADVYGEHWSLGGSPVPGSDSADRAVFLPGRALLLTAKASLWCQLRGVGTMALASLASNPFPDSRPEFDRSLEAVLDGGSEGRIRLIRPFGRSTKAEVLRLGAGLPLGSTFSCLDPVDGRHCGACNKCEERRRSFRSAAMDDPTDYAGASSATNRGA